MNEFEFSEELASLVDDARRDGVAIDDIISELEAEIMRLKAIATEAE